jgi:hypothetical protein
MHRPTERLSQTSRIFASARGAKSRAAALNAALLLVLARRRRERGNPHWKPLRLDFPQHYLLLICKVPLTDEVRRQHLSAAGSLSLPPFLPHSFPRLDCNCAALAIMGESRESGFFLFVSPLGDSSLSTRASLRCALCVCAPRYEEIAAWPRPLLFQCAHKSGLELLLRKSGRK